MNDWFTANAAAIQAFSAAAQIFVGLALIVLGVAQWSVYRKQASIMLAQLKARADLERPWLIPQIAGSDLDGELRRIVEAGGGMRMLTFSFTNQGRTPALQVRLRGEAAVAFEKPRKRGAPREAALPFGSEVARKAGGALYSKPR